jgi:hypothetical protein
MLHWHVVSQHEVHDGVIVTATPPSGVHLAILRHAAQAAESGCRTATVRQGSDNATSESGTQYSDGRPLLSLLLCQLRLRLRVAPAAWRISPGPWLVANLTRIEYDRLAAYQMAASGQHMQCHAHCIRLSDYYPPLSLHLYSPARSKLLLDPYISLNRIRAKGHWLQAATIGAPTKRA